MAKEGEFFESQNVTANQQSSVCQFLRRSKTVWHVKIQTLPLEPGAGAGVDSDDSAAEHASTCETRLIWSEHV